MRAGTHKPVGVQALGSEFPIETLDVAVVRRLARPGEVEHDAVVIGPQVEITRDNLAAIIHPNSGRVSDLPTHPFKRLDHVLALVTEADIHRRREA